MISPLPDLTNLGLAEFEAPLRGLVHSLHREDLRARVERLRFSRQAATRKSTHASRKPQTPGPDQDQD